MESWKIPFFCTKKMTFSSSKHLEFHYKMANITKQCDILHKEKPSIKVL